MVRACQCAYMLQHKCTNASRDTNDLSNMQARDYDAGQSTTNL